MQIPTPPPETKVRSAAIEAVALARVTGILTPEDFIAAKIVDPACGEYRHHHADAVFDSLVALGVVEQTEIPHTYAVAPEANFDAAIRFLRQERSPAS